MAARLAKRGAAAALLAGLLLSGGCGEPGGAVVVAAVGDWGGADEKALREGIEMAAEEVNHAGGVDGRPLEARFHDDGNDNARAARVAREPVDDPAVVAVIGHTRSDPTLVAVKVYDGRMPVLTARFTSPDVSGLSRWVFQLVPTDSAYSAAVARFAEERGWRRAALVFNNTARGRETAERFQKRFPGEVLSLDPATFPAPLPGDMKVMVEFRRLGAGGGRVDRGAGRRLPGGERRGRHPPLREPAPAGGHPPPALRVRRSPALAHLGHAAAPGGTRPAAARAGRRRVTARMAVNASSEGNASWR